MPASGCERQINQDAIAVQDDLTRIVSAGVGRDVRMMRAIMATRHWGAATGALCQGDLPHAPAQVQTTRRRMPEPMWRAIMLLLVASVLLTGCHLPITNVNIYPAFGPHFGDGH